jgi:hypothetical protein
VPEKLARRAALRIRRLGQSVVAGERSLVLGVLVVGALLRVVSLSRWSVIENEGAEYARLAFNVKHGVGYVGLHGSPQLLFPPLYSAALVAVSAVVHDLTLAGRVVSAVFGCVTILLTYLLASRWLGSRPGLAAAVIVAVSPFAIGASVSVQSEMTYTACALAGVLLIWLAVERQGWRTYAAAGAVVGLAHLTKPEALIYSACLLAASIPFSWRDRKGRLPGVAAFFATFALVAAPYVYYLHAETGRWTFEAKSGVSAAIVQREGAGMRFPEAAYGLDADGRPVGPLLEPNETARHQTLAGVIGSRPATLIRRLRQNLWPLVSTLREETFGAGLLWLAGLGVVVLLWRSRWRIAAFAAVAVVVPVGFAAALWTSPRYFVVVMPLLSILAACGIHALVAALARRTRRRMPWALYGTAGLMIAAITLPQWPILSGSHQVRYEQQPHLKQAGLWLRHHAGAGYRVMSESTRVPYYAEGTWVTLAHGPVAQLLRYAADERVDYLVVPLSSEVSRFLTTPPLGEAVGWRRLYAVHAETSRPGADLVIFGRAD